MDVEIKKTKITNNIMKQVKTASILDLINGDVLGWCIHNKQAYTVLYRSDFKELSKIRCLKTIKVDINYFCINIGFTDSSYTPGEYKCKSLEEALKLEQVLNKVRIQSNREGQFYL